LIAALTVAALVVGTVAALSVNQKLRREGTVARGIKFERIKSADGPRRVKVSFHLEESDDVEVAVVDAEGDLVRVLAPSSRLEGDDAKHVFSWDQRDEGGEPVEPGRYRLRLTLEEVDRVATSGERFVVKEPVGGQ
jgi:flagellar hook assembly protein FlgD